MVVYRLTHDPGAENEESAVIPVSEAEKPHVSLGMQPPPPGGGRMIVMRGGGKSRRQARSRGSDTRRCVCGRMGGGWVMETR